MSNIVKGKRTDEKEYSIELGITQQGGTIAIPNDTPTLITWDTVFRVKNMPVNVPNTNVYLPFTATWSISAFITEFGKGLYFDQLANINLYHSTKGLLKSQSAWVTNDVSSEINQGLSLSVSEITTLPKGFITIEIHQLNGDHHNVPSPGGNADLAPQGIKLNIHKVNP